MPALNACPTCLSVFAGHAEYCLFDGQRLGDDRILVGRSLGAYRLDELIGIGGTGCVFRGWDKISEQRCAIKLVYGEVDAAHARFQREIDAISALDHPNIVKTLGSGLSPAGLTYMVMELLDGVTLRTLIDRQAPFDHCQVFRFAEQLLCGLAEAHSHGFVHRDLKPANIMVTRNAAGDDQLKILDFGIVASLHRNLTDERLTRTGFIVGTPTYMAPEQIDAKPITPEADIYALGVILYELLTGALPFDGSNEQLLLQKLTISPPPIPEAGDFGDLIVKMLDPRPNRRPSNALNIRAALGELRKARRPQFARPHGGARSKLDGTNICPEAKRPAHQQSTSVREDLQSTSPRAPHTEQFLKDVMGVPTDLTDRRSLTLVLVQLQRSVTGFIGASLVDVASGMTLASHSVRSDLDLAVASAHNSEMVKHKLKTIEILKLKTSLEDMLLTLGDQLHLIRMITPTRFLYLAAERNMTNLALLRSAVDEVIDELR